MAIKRISISFVIILIFSFFSACINNRSPFVVEMEFTGNYDDANPFVTEQLFYVTEDAESVEFEAYLQMKSETCLLEIADNETKEPMLECFWREGFNNSGKDTEYITLFDLDKDKEYVIRLTCTEVEHVKLVMTSDSSLVKMREQPQK